MGVIRKWNGWIEECEGVGQTVDPVPLIAAFGALGRANQQRAREIATEIVRDDLAVGRFIDELLAELVEARANWPLVQEWSDSPSPRTRAVAARAVWRAPDQLARQILKKLSTDSEEVVRNTAWRATVYADNGLVGWRIDLALELTEASLSPLDELDQLLGTLRQQAAVRGSQPRLTRRQTSAVTRIAMAAAHDERSRHDHRLKMTLDEARAFGLDLGLPWLRERLEFIRQGDTTRFVEPLPDELQPLVHAVRQTASGRRELERLLDELEKPATTGLYRMAVEEAVAWLGADSPAVTRRISTWARGSDREVKLAHQFVDSGSWRVFTKRARLLLDARPDDPGVEESLITLRHPRAFVGSREPYLRARADEYRRWLKHRDARLRRIAKEAIARYESAAVEEAERERRERDAI
jgi:hypothetical protein